MHVFPSIMNVAVPDAQHSLLLGHLASSHTVYRLYLLSVSWTFLNWPSDVIFDFNHNGLRCFIFLFKQLLLLFLLGSFPDYN